MAAVFAFHTGKAVMQIAAIEIAIDHLLVIDPEKSFKIILYATVVIRRLRISRTINGGRNNPCRYDHRYPLHSQLTVGGDVSALLGKAGGPQLRFLDTGTIPKRAPGALRKV